VWPGLPQGAGSSFATFAPLGLPFTIARSPFIPLAYYAISLSQQPDVVSRHLLEDDHVAWQRPVWFSGCCWFST